LAVSRVKGSGGPSWNLGAGTPYMGLSRSNSPHVQRKKADKVIQKLRVAF
jgi:hypothetical protein